MVRCLNFLSTLWKSLWDGLQPFIRSFYLFSHRSVNYPLPLAFIFKIFFIYHTKDFSLCGFCEFLLTSIGLEEFKIWFALC